MARPAKFQFFKCPSCAALYQVVKAEAGPETKYTEIGCWICGAPFAPRDEEFVLKYFLLREAVRPTGASKASTRHRNVTPAGP